MGTSIIQQLGRQQLEQTKGIPPAGQLNVNLAITEQRNLAELNEADELARMLAMPREMVLGDITSARAKAQAMRANKLATQAPVSAQWAGKTPERTAISQPSWDNLNKIERIFGKREALEPRSGIEMPGRELLQPTRPISRGIVSATISKSLLNSDLNRMYYNTTWNGRNTPEFKRKEKEILDQIGAIQAPQAEGALETMFESAAQFTGSRITGSAAGASVAGVATVGALAVGAPVAAVAGTAFGLGTLVRGIAEQSGADIRANNSVPKADPVVADLSGRFSGLVSGSIDYLATKYVAGIFGSAYKKVVGNATAKVLQSPSTRQALINGVKAWGSSIAVETLTETTQQAISLASEQVVRSAADAPAIELERVGRELFETALTTAAGMLILGVPGGAVTTIADLGKVESAKERQAFMSALGDEVKATSLSTTSPSEFKSFAEEVVQMYGPVQNILIPIERFKAYWQEQNVDPRVVAGEIVPDIAAYDEAVSTGGDLVIPLANYVASVAPTEHHAELLQDVRFRPDDITFREAKEMEANVAEDLDGLRRDIAEAAESTPTEESAKRVVDDIAARLTATGKYTPDAVATQAQVAAAFYIGTARRAKMDPWQLYSSRNINILGPVQAERLYDAIAEMEAELAADPTSPAAQEAVKRVEEIRAEVEQIPGGAEVTQRALTPMVMPISAVDVGQRVVLEDSRSAVVTGRADGNVTVRIAGGETRTIAGDREVQVPGAVLRQERAVPTPSLETTTNLRAVFDFAQKNQFRVQRDFKLELQARAQAAAAEDGVDLTKFDAATLDYLVRVGVADAEYAMETNPNAIGWYERKVREALAISSLLYPEIVTDQNARFAFIVALAVTSNGIKVDKNFKLADEAYRAYRETGQMPTNVKAGTAQGAMNSAFALFNELVPVYGIDTLRKAMITQFDVGTLKAMGFDITGEHVDVAVRGAAIFGPKIGNGFFSNLYGFFDALTIDRWLMRSWGRWTGNLVRERPDMVAKKSDELSQIVATINQNPEAKQTVEKMLKISLDAPIEDIGNAVRKASAKEANRTVMNGLVLDGKDVGRQMRLVGNSLAGYLDGQIEAPTPDVRKTIRGVFQRVLEQLQVNNPDLTMADLQALLWYPEKLLYDSAVMEVDAAEAEYADDEAPDYSNAAVKLAQSKGIPEEVIQDVLRRERAVDGRAAATRRQLEGLGADAGASADVEGLSRQARRNFVARSVLRRLRSDIAGDGTKSETYSRNSRGVREGIRLLNQTVSVVGRYAPSVKFRNRIKAADGTALEFLELAPDATSAQVFTDAITAAKNGKRFGASVFVYSPEEYAGMRLFVAEDGRTGFALKPDGDIVSVFSYGVPGGARGAIELAIQQGGRKLDAFATVLPEYYFAHGMREVARLPWDDTQAPPDWDANTFGEFNDGRPDVVFMVFDSEFAGPYETAPYAESYDAAVDRQTSAIRELDARKARMSVPQILEQAATNPEWLSRVAEDADQSLRILVRSAFRTPPVYVELPETIDIDGVQRPTRNNKGQQITRDERTMRAFWRWFGDSKLVDEQGRPIVIYHGTSADVDFVEFKPNIDELGTHTGTPEQANRFAEGMNRVTDAAGARVYTLYGRLQNPLRLVDRGGFTSETNVLPQLYTLGIITREEMWNLGHVHPMDTPDNRARRRTSKQIAELTIQLLKDKGYDGIIYLNRFEGYSEKQAKSEHFNETDRESFSDDKWAKTFSDAKDSYIVFDSQQLKSTANVGSFSRATKNILRQDSTKRPNAFIIPGVSRTTIGLMRTANLSSLMHEFSHDYLNLLFDVAEMPEATEEIRADADAVLKYFNITDRGQLTTEHQEKWARMFESYLMEGKAPSKELQSAFGRFRVWLTAIYRAVTSALVPVSPEIRGVFDRMLASDEQIAEAVQQDELGPLFESASEAGMSEAEFKAYREAVAARDENAKRTLMVRLVEEQNKERRQFWKDREAEVRQTVTEQVAMEPIQQVVHFLKTGALLSGETLPEDVTPYKLSKALLVSRYGPEVVKGIPRGTYSVEGGVDPDVVALSFGFDSGDAMISQMQAFEPRQARIDRIVKETMAQEFPDLLNDSPALAEAAQDAVHQAPSDQLLYAELVKLGKLDAMIPPTNLFAVRQAAKEIIAKTRIRDLVPDRFRRAEAKAGRLAYQAMRQGDKVKAAFHKRQQLLNHLLYREATASIELANKAYKFFGKMAKGPYQQRLGKAGQEYLQQMNALLDQYDFSRISGIEAERRMALSEWAAAQVARGIPVEIPVSVLYSTQRTNYRLLTVEQLQGVYDTGRQIYHVARNEGKLLAAAEKASFEEVVEEIVAGIGQEHKIEPREPDYAPSKLKALANALKKLDAWHVKPEFLFRWLDGDKAFGPVHQALFEPIARAENAESEMVIEANKRVEALFNLIPKGRRKEYLSRRIQVPGVSTRMTGATALAMALNWGNTSNREALLEGTIAGRPVFTPQQIDAVLRTLTKAEWDFVQGVWDYINEFWPQIAELQRSLTGVAPEKVEAEAFTVTTADGETVNLRGGYYPLAYDQNYNWAQFKQDMAADVKDLGANSYTRAATRHGFTEARVGSGGRPVKLDLSVFSEHVLNVIHDLTHRKAIMDVQKLAENAEVREAIEGTAGRDLYRIIRPWLVRIAGDRRPPASPMEDFVGRARTGVTVVNMGLKVTTAIVQPIGYLQSLEMLGANYGRRGLTAFFANPAKLASWVKEQSVAIRTRQQSFDRDVRDQTKRMLKKGPLTRAQESFFFFTGLMDMSVAIPTWYGAYLKSIETMRPGDHHAAVTYADSVVRMTQGSGAAKDLAQIQGGGDLARSFTLFYTYFNALYNLLRRSGALLKDRGPRDTGRFLASMAVLWFLPAVMSELIAGRGPDEDEEEDTMQWALWKMLRYPFSTVVGVRDIAAAIGPEAYDYELSPVVSAGRSVVESINAIGKAAGEAYRGDGFELTEGEVKQFIMAIGYWGQLPSRQMWITGSYIYDWMMGYEEPETPADVLQGLAFPRQK